MFTAPASPEENRHIRVQFGRYRVSFLFAAVITLGLTFGMIVSDMVLLAMIVAGIGVYGSLLLFGRMRALKAALGEASLLVFKGPIEKKELRSRFMGIKEHRIFVEGENHIVPAGFFAGVDEGDTVELHFCPYARLLTFARLHFRRGAQTVAQPPAPAVEPRAYAPSLPGLVMYAQPADLGGYDRQHDAFSQEPERFQGTLSPGVSYDDPTVAVRLCTRCRYPLDPVSGTCAQCDQPRD